MSLDVWLTTHPIGVERECEHCGKSHKCQKSEEVFKANITHNLTAMAREAGIYEALWRPEVIGVTKAGQLVKPLMAGLHLLLENPRKFKALNPENGWGGYNGLLKFASDYAKACVESPTASINIWL